MLYSCINKKYFVHYYFSAGFYISSFLKYTNVCPHYNITLSVANEIYTGYAMI